MKLSTRGARHQTKSAAPRHARGRSPQVAFTFISDANGIACRSITATIAHHQTRMAEPPWMNCTPPVDGIPRLFATLISYEAAAGPARL